MGGDSSQSVLVLISNWRPHGAADRGGGVAATANRADTPQAEVLAHMPLAFESPSWTWRADAAEIGAFSTSLLSVMPVLCFVQQDGGGGGINVL